MMIGDAFLKKPHAKGCEGALYRKRETVTIDRAGRVGNGGWVAHEYVCNRAYAGCRARVLVTEVAVRKLAVNAEVR